MCVYELDSELLPIYVLDVAADANAEVYLLLLLHISLNAWFAYLCQCIPLSFQCERVKVPEIYVTYERYAVKTTPRSSATIVSNKLIFSPVVYMHIKSNDLVRRFIADSGCSPCFVVTAKVKITHAHTYYLDTQIHIHSLGFHPLSQFQFDFLS